LHFAWPLLVLYLALNVPAWQVYVMLFQPDLGYWLETVATAVFLKGLLEIVLIWRVFSQTYQRQVLQPRASAKSLDINFPDVPKSSPEQF
jgi:hypothetical protein